MERRCAYAILVVLLSSSLAGCSGGQSNGGGSSSDVFEVPVWETGDWWLYTFSTPDYNDDTARLVVASDSEEDGTAYMLAISSLTEARRHAVLNHNPFLGRITHTELGAFENGVAQPVLSFPIEEGISWTFTLFSMEWDAFVSDVSGSTAVIIASSSDGSRLDYVFDNEVGFFYSFTWKDPLGVTNLRMMLSDSGSGHTGDVHFVRGGDLFNKLWEDSGNDIEIRDTFLVNDHPSDGEWDEMIYFIDAECGSSSSISLTLRDHMSISALERIWGPGASEMGTLGTIPYPSGEYTLTATFTGSSTFLRVRIAGGITQSWSL
ncbi:MAG TPA: hypothetical protein QF821_03870 [Candidatus Thalassarchaeaceae archaeon]|jgi:hypothetical protein|nr:hypothetical protein [Candidatus Thalassarchaeaceae archaeon]